MTMALRDFVRMKKGARTSEQLSAACNGMVSAKTFETWMYAKIRNVPDTRTIHAAVVALDCTEPQLMQVICAEVGIDIGQTPSRLMALAPAGTELIDDEGVSALLPMLSLLAREAKVRAQENPLPPAEVKEPTQLQSARPAYRARAAAAREEAEKATTKKAAAKKPTKATSPKD